MNDVKVLEGALSRSMTIRAVKCVCHWQSHAEESYRRATTQGPIRAAGYDCVNNATSREGRV